MNEDDMYTGHCPENFDPSVWATLTRDQKTAVQHLRWAEHDAASKDMKDKVEAGMFFAIIPFSINLGIKEYLTIAEERTIWDALWCIVAYLVLCVLFLGVFSSVYNRLIAPERKDSKFSYVIRIIGVILVSLIIDGLLFKAFGYV